MKKAALLFGGLLLSALVSGVASAEVVRVRLTARVMQVDDSSNVLAGKVVNGQRVTGLYVYNTNTPNQAQYPGEGEYWPYANEGRLRFAIGSLVFESKQPTQGIRIHIFPERGGSGQFNIDSSDNKPLADGTPVDYIGLNLNGNGNVTQSEALPNVAPVLTQYYMRDAMIGGAGYNIRVRLEAAERIVPDAIVVSPASGTFAANQHFDAAVILPRNSVVQQAQATANGLWLPLNYPGGGCQLQPQVGTGKPSLLCPGADAVLTTIPAGTPIEWAVTLSNGTVYTETVTWDRAP